jgi:acyl-CoA dehydrogenase
MAIGFTLEPRVRDPRDRVRAFVADVVIPAEEEMLADPHGVSGEHRAVLQRAARHAGLLAPHVGEEWG